MKYLITNRKKPDCMSMVNATELSTISRTGESLATIPRKFPQNSYRVGYKDCFDLYFASDECVPESKTITVVHDSLSKSYVDSKESIVWGSEPEPIFLSRLKIPIMI